MSFNKGYELKKFEAHWEKLRIEYAAAGMTEDAIQKMYDYDRQQFNSDASSSELSYAGAVNSCVRSIKVRSELNC